MLFSLSIWILQNEIKREVCFNNNHSINSCKLKLAQINFNTDIIKICQDKSFTIRCFK
jgi:hypothetical protein